MTILTRIMREEPRPSEDRDGMGCGSLVAALLGFLIFAAVSWGLVNWLAWI